MSYFGGKLSDLTKAALDGRAYMLNHTASSGDPQAIVLRPPSGYELVVCGLSAQRASTITMDDWRIGEQTNIGGYAPSSPVNLKMGGPAFGGYAGYDDSGALVPSTLVFRMPTPPRTILRASWGLHRTELIVDGTTLHEQIMFPNDFRIIWPYGASSYLEFYVNWSGACTGQFHALFYVR